VRAERENTVLLAFCPREVCGALRELFPDSAHRVCDCRKGAFRLAKIFVNNVEAADLRF
jgi:hypothetical protein